jgi:hypothetical protein
MRGRQVLYPVFLAGAAMAVIGATRPQGSPLDRLAWLSGCWELRQGARVTLEMWMPPAGAMMLGASRTVSGGAVREFEQLRLGWIADSLVYFAQPSGQPPATFKGGAPSDTGFVVENLEHDFPQRIIYRRRGADSLVARIEGPGQAGTIRGIDYSMKRVGCTAS